jgi:acetyltransferase-like isoleucine patch superfamily enzyme
VTISPGVNIASHSIIEENTFIGIGTTIINNIKIGKNVIVGAGSVVTRNLESNGIYYGVPAKFIRMNDFSL